MKRRQVEHADDDGRYKQAGSAVVASEPAMPLARGRRHAAFQRKQSALNEQFAAWVAGQVGTTARPLALHVRMDCARSLGLLSLTVLTRRHSLPALLPTPLLDVSHTLTHRPSSCVRWTAR
jgi:hypothetical protein